MNKSTGGAIGAPVTDRKFRMQKHTFTVKQAHRNGQISTHSRRFGHIATGRKHAILHKATSAKKEERLCSRRRGWAHGRREG